VPPRGYTENSQLGNVYGIRKIRKIRKAAARNARGAAAFEEAE